MNRGPLRCSVTFLIVYFTLFILCKYVFVYRIIANETLFQNRIFEIMKRSEEYFGFPRYVVITLPKSGSKSMNKAFKILGFKVYDCHEMNDHSDMVS
jgi:hypothetical protein